jgi:hypothetical protein
MKKNYFRVGACLVLAVPAAWSILPLIREGEWGTLIFVAVLLALCTALSSLIPARSRGDSPPQRTKDPAL